MRMVAAAKVAKASELNAEYKPNIVFTQNTVEFLKGKLGDWQNEIPIVAPREVKKVLLIATSGDRGLCGGFNSKAIKKVVKRKEQLERKGLEVELVAIGEKMRKYLGRRYPLRAELPLGKPAAEDCHGWVEDMSPWLVKGYLDGDYDKVEVVYTQFVSMISCEVVVKTLLPYTELGGDEEIAALTSEDGELDVELEAVPEGEEFKDWAFELDQSPDFLIEWMGELFLTSAILTTWLETFASELSSRVLAMQTATDNAEELSAKLIQIMNRKRQGKVTQEMCEIAGGAIAFDEE
jgi:F-type H+-transporting ATPase subunit gamma